MYISGHGQGQVQHFLFLSVRLTQLNRKSIPNETGAETLIAQVKAKTASCAPGYYIRGTQRQFLENVCSEDDLRSRIFGAFVVKFLACLPL